MPNPTLGAIWKQQSKFQNPPNANPVGVKTCIAEARLTTMVTMHLRLRLLVKRLSYEGVVHCLAPHVSAMRNTMLRRLIRIAPVRVF